MIPYGKQSISQEDIDAVVDVLKSDWLTQGPTVKTFENTVREYCHSTHAIAVNSATSALHLACLALEVGPNDIVWTSPISFVASANCALYCGADVDFVDVDANTGNMSVTALEKKLVEASQNNALPKVVIPVHLAGQSCDMEAIKQLADQYHFKIIEDASHAIGSKYKSAPVGSCAFSDICVFSFHPVKIITSAEGGCLTTNSETLAQRAAQYRTHGITNQIAELELDYEGPWYYEQQALGFNYRLSDLHAALGVSQFKQLDQFTKKRNLLARRYDNLLDRLNGISHLTQSPDVYSAYHLYVIQLSADKKQARRSIVESLREQGVFAQVHYIPIYRQPFYKKMGFDPADFPQSEAYYEMSLTLPLYPDLTEKQQDTVVKLLEETL